MNELVCSSCKDYSAKNLQLVTLLISALFMLITAATEVRFTCDLYNQSIPIEFSDRAHYLFKQQQDLFCKDVRITFQLHA
jgi:hypothetical protein